MIKKSRPTSQKYPDQLGSLLWKIQRAHESFYADPIQHVFHQLHASPGTYIFVGKCDVQFFHLLGFGYLSTNLTVSTIYADYQLPITSYRLSVTGLIKWRTKYYLPLVESSPTLKTGRAEKPNE